jgi:hypothetical protein
MAKNKIICSGFECSILPHQVNDDDNAYTLGWEKVKPNFGLARNPTPGLRGPMFCMRQA